ncbi:monovalent cation/H(+) antiporter subunit G [Bartonella sp. HY761]|uniref:monovalent cation/H(+) antiporter subunit G n=1 Tax=Bartonella sp. HY761 TaxID=2979330 RepID=UPI002203068C|nr:monovalent cation/H(+) antiporter subunit G [Bartonella sp. HY761]UXN06764.1 monovalent cation/H(+) antiporter subunit G [Bartonella sp. HY761]
MSEELVKDLPIGAALLIAFFMVLGSSLTLLGCVGLIRFKNFYDRLHMPTLGTTWGVGGIIIASILFFTMTSGRLVIHELLITVFIVVTTPVTLMMLSRGALHRDRSNDWRDLPPELFDLYRAPKEEAAEITPIAEEKADERPQFPEYHSS